MTAAEIAPLAMVGVAAMGQIVQIALTQASVRDLKEWRKDEVDPFMGKTLEWRGKVNQKLRELSPHHRSEYDEDESRHD